MSDWPVGLSTGSFYQISIFDCLEAIRAAGFGMIEICYSPIHLDYHDLDTVRHAAYLIKELDLEAYSFHAPFIDVDISSTNAIECERSLKGIIRAVEAAGILETQSGSITIVVMPESDPEFQQQSQGTDVELVFQTSFAATIRRCYQNCSSIPLIFLRKCCVASQKNNPSGISNPLSNSLSNSNVS